MMPKLSELTTSGDDLISDQEIRDYLNGGNPLSERCPSFDCLAMPGDPCSTELGLPPGPHLARVLAASLTRVRGLDEWARDLRAARSGAAK